MVVLRQAGLPAGLFNQEKILVTTEESFALYRGISEVSRHPNLGLKLGTEGRVQHSSLVEFFPGPHTSAPASAPRWRDRNSGW